MRIDLRSELRELPQLGIAENVAVPLEDRAPPRVDDEAIRVDRAGNQLLAKSPDRLDRGAVASTGDRVRGEEDARAVRIDHPLDHDGEAKTVRSDPVRLAICDRAVIPERRPAFAHGIQDSLVTARPEDRVLLTGKARLRQVFRGRRRADRDGWRSQGAVGLADRFGDRGRDGRGREAETGRRRGVRRYACRLSSEGVRGRRDQETVGHWKARAKQFPEVGALPPGDVDLGCRDIGERPNEHARMLGAGGTYRPLERNTHR